MSEIKSRAGVFVGAPRVRILFNLKMLCGMLLFALLVAASPARGDDPDDQYLRIWNLIQQADALNAGSQTAPAIAKYREAMIALQTCRKENPGWKPQLLAFREKYVAAKIGELTEKASAPVVSTPAPGAGDSKTEANSASAAANSPVKLLQPGAEPRKVLRLHPKAGDKQSVTIALKLSIESKVGEMQTPAMKMPAMNFALDFTVKDVSAEGDINYDIVMGEATVGDETGVMPQISQAIKSSLGGLKGATGSGTTSNRGLSRRMEFKAPAGADAQGAKLVSQMKEFVSKAAFQLPEEAVGVGAKWTAKMTMKSEGMTIDETETYELTSLEGERVTAKTTMVQSAASQKIENPAMPGMKVDLTKMSGSGKGETTADLSHFLPELANADVHTEMSMTMNLGGQKQAMMLKTDATYHIEAK
jgi:phosphotransferase system HPr-like phosphotransfer protein